MSQTYPPGTVGYVTIADPNGQNPKTRPVVVICEDDDEPGLFVVVAITTRFDLPLQTDEIMLPYSNDPKTRASSGLTRPSVAKASWAARIRMVEFEYVGWIRRRLVEEIIDRMS